MKTTIPARVVTTCDSCEVDSEMRPDQFNGASITVVVDPRQGLRGHIVTADLCALCVGKALNVLGLNVVKRWTMEDGTSTLNPRR